MRIIDLLRFARERGEPVFSFEFFPPKTDDGERALFDTIEALRPRQAVRLFFEREASIVYTDLLFQ